MKQLIVSVQNPNGSSVEAFDGDCHMESDHSYLLKIMKGQELVAVFHAGQWGYARYEETRKSAAA